MFQVEKSVVIERSSADVFAFVADQRNAVRWQAGITEIRTLTEPPIGVGTRHALARTFLGRRMEVENVYTEYDPDTFVAFRTTSGPVALVASYLVVPHPQGSTLTSSIQMDAKGFLSLAEPLIAAGLRRDVAAALLTLKGVLET
ncbi:SRPBCC family protein [Longivirga aurantiaca]|uniref:SRPBCC family protein n=1 Tax=Longivirga aurantiaca TaxID=1837743 RepID=A0ABW1SWK9_9ACTN